MCWSELIGQVFNELAEPKTHIPVVTVVAIFFFSVAVLQIHPHHTVCTKRSASAVYHWEDNLILVAQHYRIQSLIRQMA